jgi:hypothetical protein
VAGDVKGVKKNWGSFEGKNLRFCFMRREMGSFAFMQHSGLRKQSSVV